VVDAVLGVRGEVVGMVAYFVRRIIGGIITWLLIAFLLYSWLVPSLISSLEHPCFDCRGPGLQIAIKRVTIMYAYDKPWPLNYLTWLFDPSGVKRQTFSFPGGVTMGGYMPPKP